MPSIFENKLNLAVNIAKIVLILAIIIVSCNCSRGIRNPSGWPIKIGGPNAFCNPSHIAADSAGNVYISGVWNGSVDFDPGPSKDIGFSREISSFIAEYNGKGQLEWCERFPQYSRELSFNDMCCDSSGRLYICGIRFTSSGDLAVLMAYDGNGNLRWQNEWSDLSGEGDGCRVKAMTIDSSNNIYIVGDYKGDVHFGPEGNDYSETPSGRDQHAFVCKLNNNGETIWLKAWRGGWKEIANSIAIADDGSVYVSGTCDISKELIFNTGEKYRCNPSRGLMGWYLLRMEEDCHVNWVRYWSSAINDWGCDVRKIAIFGDSQVFVLGDYKGKMYTEFGETMQSFTPSGGKDVFLFSLDSSGFLLWGHTWGGTSWDYAKTLLIDPSGQIWCSGIFEGSVDFDSGPGEHIEVTENQGEFETKSFLSIYAMNGQFKSVKTGRFNEGFPGVIVNGTYFYTGSFEKDANLGGSSESTISHAIGLRDGFVNRMPIQAIIDSWK